MLLEKILFLYEWLFLGKSLLVGAFFILTVLLIAVSILSYRLESGSVFFAVLSVFVGGMALLFDTNGINFQEIIPFFALLCMVVGITYFTYFVSRKCLQRKRRLRTERESLAREMQYALPQKDNTFIRSRLNAVSGEEKIVADGDELPLRYTYAKNLLEKLRLQNLSATERLETDELASVFAVYIKKERYTTEDVRLISEAFSRILKLSAKYGV